jgi:hypothetical protein
MKFRRLLVTAAVSLTVILAITCSKKSTETEPNKNNIPKIDSLTVDRNVSNMDWGATCIIRCKATDGDSGDKLSYKWKVSGGRIIPLSEVQPLQKRSGVKDSTFLDWSDSTQVGWKAPSLAGGYFCTVWVKDGKDSVTQQVSLSVFDHPKLDLSPKTLKFDPATDKKQIVLANIGTGVLEWGSTVTSNDKNWLSISPTQGRILNGTQSSVEASVNRSGLGGGAYSGLVVIGYNGVSDTVKVDIDVPQLSVDKEELNFDSTKTRLTFTVSNTGKGELSWKNLESASWITDVDPDSGKTGENSQQEVAVTVSRTGLSSGPYESTLQVNSKYGNRNILIKMAVPSPVLSVSPETLDLGELSNIELKAGLAVIQNAGGGLLVWNAVKNDPAANWLTAISPDSGSTRTETDSVRFTVDGAILQDGANQTTVAFRSNGGNKQITVKAKRTPPVLYVSKSEVDFGSIKETQTNVKTNFQIKNSGKGKLTWSIQKDDANANWLTDVSPDTGSSTGEYDAVNLSVNGSLLNDGSNTTTLTISSNGGAKQITIKAAKEKPVLDVTKTLVFFGLVEGIQTQTFGIKNKGNGTLTWTVVKDDPAASWLTTVAPASGTTTTETDNVTLTVNGTLLGEGVNTTTVTVQSDGGNTTITVKAEKTKPILDVTKTLVDFGSVTGTQTQTFGIKNKGNGTLTWTVAKDNPAVNWLTTVSPSAGTTTTETDNVTLTVNGALLGEGVNTTTVTVQSSGGDTTITVKAEKTKPVLDVTKTLVDFGIVTGTQTQIFGIKNKGTGTLSWTATKGDAAAAWLTGVSPASGTATTETDNITLTVNGALLSPGVNNTTVKVQSNGGDTTVTVTATKSDVSSGQWISYDDGSFEGSMAVGASGWLWARFTRPTGWTHCKVTKVKVYVKSGSSYSYDIDGFDNYQYSNGYYYPSGTYSSLKTSVSQGTGWSTFDLTTPKTFSSSEFFIALWALSSSGPYYGNDTSNPSAARCGGIISPYNMLIKGAQWGIQVYAENTTTSSPAGSIAGKGTASPEKGVWLKAEVQYRQLKNGGESVGNLKERINK